MEGDLLVRIGQLAAETGVPAKTIRFYEDVGVLPPPDRTPSGYRDYDEKAAKRLGFVRSAQRAGLTLKEVRAVFDIRDGGEAPCRHVADLVERKLTEIDERMQALRNIKKELHRLAERAERLSPGDCSPGLICPIISPD
ncbi:MAG: heavy metal-responsive transcriptional regulator [Acidimicrobiia bacterium]